MARDDELVLPKWFSLPGGKKIGIGRRWHGLTNFAWMVNGLIYTILLFGTGQWRRLVPTSWDVFPEAWTSLRTYASFNLPPVEDFAPYDALQQLTYAFIVFVVAPMMILTGIAMSPAVVWLADPRQRGIRNGAGILVSPIYVVHIWEMITHVILLFDFHREINLGEVSHTEIHLESG